VSKQAFVHGAAGDDGIRHGGGLNAEFGKCLGGIFGADVLNYIEMSGLSRKLAANLVADADEGLTCFRTDFFFFGQVDIDTGDGQVVGKGDGISTAIPADSATLVGDLDLLYLGRRLVS
jgi:hypothetical protein